MIFKDLFGPKWKSSKADVRLNAVAALDLAQDRAVLLSLASTDGEAAVRLAALRRLHDRSVFGQRLAEETDPGVRQYLGEQLARALLGAAEWAMPLPERLTALLSADEALLERCARHGAEPEFRQAALALIERESLCAELALTDAVLELRLAALAKVHKKALLERVYKDAKNKDKRIAREARERLDALDAQERKPEAVLADWRALVQGLEALAVEAEVARGQSRFQQLQTQWQALLDETPAAQRKRLPEDLAGRAERAVERARRHLHQLRDKAEQAEALHRAKRERETLINAAETLLAEIRSAHSPKACDADAWRAMLDIKLDNWRQCRAEAGASQGDYEARFKAIVSACERALTELALYEQALGAREAVLAQMRRLETELTDVSDFESAQTIVSALRRAWREAPALAELRLPEAMLADYARLDGVLAERLGAERKQRSEAQGAAARQLARLEALLRAGRTRLVSRLIEETGSTLAALPDSVAAPLRKRHDDLAAKLAALQDWRIWAALPRKEALCAELEALLASPLSLREQEQQLKALRSQWRTLGATAPAQDEALERRFEAAYSAALEPVKAHREALRAQQAQVQQLRYGLCEELEALAQSAAVPAPDFKALEAAYAALRQRWQSAGPLPPALWEACHGRYRAAAAALETVLRAEQSRISAAKEALVAEAEKALALGDDRAAAETIKRLQQQWKALGRGLSRQEAPLWHAFRAACDGVFEARDQVFAARRAAEQETVKARTALCEALEALLLQGADAEALAGLQAAWAELPVTRDERALELRWQTALSALADTQAREARAREQASLDALAQRAALCQAKERGEEVEAAWGLAPELPGTWAEAMAARWQMTAVSPEAFAEAAAKRAELVLRLEILAGIDSPAELAEARMRLKVARLAGRLREGEQGADALRRELTAAWYLAGPQDAAQADLAIRFHNALAACQ